MNPDIELLHRIRIASPCTASWDEMRGDERVRFCQHCRLNVYNLSAMESQAAEALVLEKEGRLCVRYYARPDGTMLVKDCPVGFRAVRRTLLAQLGTIGAVFALMFGSVPMLSGERRGAVRNSWLGQIEPFRSFFEWLDPTPQFMVLGSPVLPTPPADLLSGAANSGKGSPAGGSRDASRLTAGHASHSTGSGRLRGHARRR